MIARAGGRARAALRSHWALAAGVFLLLAVAHTWPLATAPGTLSRNDNGDAQLNEWIVAWVAHQLPRDPAQLFQGNIFYPARDVLAFSEPLIVPALIAAPALWAGASPVLAINILMFAGFVLTALAGYAVVYAWTRDRLAALTAGSLLAFNAHTLTRLAHVQAVHAYGLPLAVLLTDRLVERPRAGSALALGAVMAMTAYTSGYIAVFAIVTVSALLLAWMPRWLPRARAVLLMFGMAAAVGAILALPLLLPYARVAVQQRMVRPLAETAAYSATLSGYLAAPGRIHVSLWSADRFATPVDAFFPGLVAALLASAAVAGAVRGHHRWRILALWFVGATGLVLSLGLATPLYGWLYAVFPPMRGLRAAARFGFLFLLAVALLAGLGMAYLRSAARSALATAAAVTVLALVNLEALRAPFEYRRWNGIPPIYGMLAREPGAVVLAEMPFYPPDMVFENAEYVLNSTAHWRPLLNGYSGYVPRSFEEIAPALWRFPDERALDALRRSGATHITVHPRRYGAGAAGRLQWLAGRRDFELVGIDAASGVRLYRYRPEP